MTDAVARAEVLDLSALKARPVPQIPPAGSVPAEATHAMQPRLGARRMARGERPAVLKPGLTGAARL